MRSKNPVENAIAVTIYVLIREHKSQFQVKETHYGGKLKQYLDSKINISKMYIS